MPKHGSTPPPPAASKGLDLDDLMNNLPSKHTKKQATTSFPATAQKSTRIKTERAPLGDPGRTVLEGLAPPTAFQTVVRPTVVPVKETIYKTSKHKSTRPPPAANSGLNLDDLNNSPSKHTHKQATTSFPATAEKSTRIKTELAPLGDPGRTILEGLALPTALQTVVDPTVVPATQYKGMLPPSQGAGYPAHTPSMISATPSIKSATPATQLKGMAPPSQGAGYPAHTPSMIPVAPSIKSAAPATQLKGMMVPPSQGAGYPAHTPSIHSAAPSTTSAAPNWAKSVFTKPEDQKMATRQTAYSTLSPAEQAKQNTWAQSMINRSIQCPQGYDWNRNQQNQGYQCAGGHHFVTDELLREGKGGVLLIQGGSTHPWWGPYYPDPQNPERLVYGGSQTGHHSTSFGPDWMDPKTSTWHWPKLWQIIEGVKGPPGNEADYPLLEQGLELFFNTPRRIRSKSHGATLFLRRKDTVNIADSPHGWQYRNGSWAPPSGAGSGLSYAGLRHSPSKLHTDDFGLQVISLDTLHRKKDFQRSHSGSESRSSGSPSNSHSSISSSALSSPGTRHSTPPRYSNDTNAFGASPSGYHPSNPNRPSSNNLWTNKPNSPWDRHGAGSNNFS
jgi:hypothetical protein